MSEKTLDDFRARGYRVNVVLEWDYTLGPKWLNPDNLEVLLFTSQATNPTLLRVIDFEEVEREPMGTEPEKVIEATPEEISP